MTAKIIRESLINQLKARKADTPFFVELVDEYMYLRNQLSKLKKAVKEVGLYEEEIFNNSGAKRLKANPMLKEVRETEKQMISILEKLKLSIDNVIAEDEEDEL